MTISLTTITVICYYPRNKIPIHTSGIQISLAFDHASMLDCSDRSRISCRSGARQPFIHDFFDSASFGEQMRVRRTKETKAIAYTRW